MLIIAWIALFMILVIIHELGHFWTAKKSGVQVLEFGIGIPPKLFTLYTDKTGTEYTINLIPLGGFVRLKGEDSKDEETFKAPDSFIMAWFRKKVIILCGGVIMNFIAAYLIFAFALRYGSKPITILPSNATVDNVSTRFVTTFDQLIKNNQVSGDISAQAIQVADVLPDSLIKQAGVKPGDNITHINGKATNSMIINRQLKELIGKQFSLDYKASGSNATSTTSITCPADQCLLGIVIDTNNVLEVKPYKYGLKDSLIYAWDEVIGQSRLSLNTIGNLLWSLVSFDGTSLNKQANNLTGPAWAIKIGEIIYEAGWWMQFLIFGAMISLSLAVFNILPIPALDGGRLLGVIIQKIIWLSAEKYFTIESYINVVFFVLMMGLGIFILFRDLTRIWWLF